MPSSLLFLTDFIPSIPHGALLQFVALSVSLSLTISFTISTGSVYFFASLYFVAWLPYLAPERLQKENPYASHGPRKLSERSSISKANLKNFKPMVLFLGQTDSLPPQSLRRPPSVTPRGSALKKGIPPGPIREMQLPTKKLKLKRARKAIKGKRLRKIKSLPA